MLLDLLGLAVEKVLVPFQEAGGMVQTSHWTPSRMRHRFVLLGKLFGSGWGIHGLHKSPREVRCRTRWLCSVCAEALADQAEVGLCFMAWAEAGLGPGASASLANTEL